MKQTGAPGMAGLGDWKRLDRFSQVSLAIFVSQIGDLHIENYIVCQNYYFGDFCEVGLSVQWEFFYWDFLGSADFPKFDSPRKTGFLVTLIGVVFGIVILIGFRSRFGGPAALLLPSPGNPESLRISSFVSDNIGQNSSSGVDEPIANL